MNWLSLLLRRNADHRSLRWHDSKTNQGVRYAVRQASLAQRIELNHRVREVFLKHEFLQSGPLKDRLEASLSDLNARKIYLEWGLSELEGLSIDGQKASTDLLIEKGPESLSNEIVRTIRSEISLSEDEIKNF